MGARIKTTTIVLGNGDDSSIEIAAKAVKECIEKAGVNKREIGLLINTGIQRDKNIVEPAVASLIQKKADLNLNPPESQLAQKLGTLSFDLLYGTCGFIYAVQIIDAFFKVGTTEKAIIVSSDVHPSGKKIQNFPFTPSAAAVLLEKSPNGQGFQNFMFKTSETGNVGVEQYCNTMDHANCRGDMIVDIAKDYSTQLSKFIVNAVHEYAQSGAIDLSKVKHIITSTPSSRFGREVADNLGFRNNTLVEVFNQYGDTNTSSLIIGFHLAAEKGELKEGEHVLFASGSGGLSMACSTYVI
jgi:3-oxoacyl-[acyl-carrier-protein] synthase-3